MLEADAPSTLGQQKASKSNFHLFLKVIKPQDDDLQSICCRAPDSGDQAVLVRVLIGNSLGSLAGEESTESVPWLPEKLCAIFF